MKQLDTVSHLFSAPATAQYYDTPRGCLRLVRIDGDVLIGTRYNQSYRMPLCECKRAQRRGVGQNDRGFEE
jgi:hypothetical protein